MSVKSGAAAYTELSHRLGHKPDGSPWPKIQEQYPFVRDDPPPGFTIKPAGPDDVWGTVQSVPPLRDPESYQLPGLAGPLNRPPAEALEDPDPQQRRAYCDASIDITMRGGTTSGVVYPMAVCELARAYRLRNIGGASAGAIAAAAAAAAEAGRSGEPAAPAALPGDDARRQGHFRPGFAGFADCMAWLAQIDDPGPDEFRVGQLFRPTQSALPLFRLGVAYMRRRYLAIPLLFAGAFGKVSKWANIVIAAAALVLAGLWGGWSGLAQGAVGLIALTLLAAGLVAAVVVLTRKQEHLPEELDDPVPVPPEPATSLRNPAILLAVGLGGLLADVFVLGAPFLRLLALWLFTVVALVLVAITSVLRLVLGAEKHSFGLVSGSSPKLGKSVWNWVAGLPRATVDRPLVSWLSGTLSQLSGLDADIPLRFGHLWFGRQYQPGSETAETCRRAARDSAWRRINLELVTTELVQGLSYKFPLPPGDDLEAQTYSALYVRRRDLEAPGAEIFPPAVVDALCAAPAEPGVYDRRTGDQLTDLHRLPEPWDLPVIFAVRLSMSLPALLEAVRVYRISRRPSIVRDEFGQPISGGSAGPLMYPAGTGQVWAEELWFSDGGITSNFPIHLFDSLFPRWPTVGITLSRHQPGFRHQDVWLPQDWQGRQVIGAPVSGGMAGFTGAIVSAARGWRDTAQSQMPAFVGRIATVRQRKDEGGTNLFMARETIAALALRGELAGVRLRRRFGSPWWRRNQWIRFRSAIGNLEELHEAMLVNIADDAYLGLASATGAGALATLEASLVQGDPDMPRPDDWWQPSAASYWESAEKLTAAISAIPAADALTDGVSEPEPQLRQVPPA